MPEFQRILEAYGVEEKLPSVLRCFNLTNETYKVMAKLASVLAENIDTVLNRFYAFMLRPEILIFFQGEDQIKRLKAKNRVSFVETFTPPIDEKYLIGRLKIGYKHFQINLPSQIYWGGLLHFEKVLTELWREQFPDPKELYQAMRVTQTIVSIEGSLTTEAVYLCQQIDLQQKEQGTRNLIRVISHDIYNPLSVIMGYCKILQSSLAKPQEKKQIDRIRGNAEHIDLIIRDAREILSFTDRNESLDLKPQNIESIFGEVQDLFQQRLEEKNIALKIVKEEKGAAHNGSCLILGTKTGLLHTVFANIVSNAIKFSHPNSSITLSQTCYDDRIVVEIQDQGTGIADDQLRNLFDPQKTLSQTGTLGEKGTGFGIPLVKAYMDKIGGKITVTSRHQSRFPESSGTTFKLEFTRTLG